MIRRPPRSTRTDTLFPYTTLFRSIDIQLRSGPNAKMRKHLRGQSDPPSSINLELWHSDLQHSGGSIQAGDVQEYHVFRMVPTELGRVWTALRRRVVSAAARWSGWCGDRKRTRANFRT